MGNTYILDFLERTIEANVNNKEEYFLFLKDLINGNRKGSYQVIRTERPFNNGERLDKDEPHEHCIMSFNLEINTIIHVKELMKERHERKLE